MDNDAKLSAQQIKNLISDFKNAKADDTVSLEDFTNKHLNKTQADTIKKAMSDPELIKKILSSKKTQEFLSKLKGDGNSNES